MKPRSILSAQMLSNIAEKSGFTIIEVKKVLDTYGEEAEDAMLNGKKVPLPGSMGYLSLSVTTTKTRTVELKLTNSTATISPRLRVLADFSAPWIVSINKDKRSNNLIQQFIDKRKQKEFSHL